MKTFNIGAQHVVTVDFDVTLSVCLIAQIQLACRHPKNLGASREIVEGFARMLQQEVSKVAPENDVVMEMGWNPDYDVE